MEKVIEYVTELDGIEFGYWPEEGSSKEGELQSVEPVSAFERATVETFDALKYSMHEELVELAKRVEALEGVSGSS